MSKGPKRQIQGSVSAKAFQIWPFGSLLKHIDFYLVDLRRARYDDDQAAWFKRCGAILFDKR